jgi:arsenite/tail-anchored protein-transporting ATPase
MLLSWLRRRRRPGSTGAPHAAAGITFFGGKGGVGKTTCAAAFALRLSDQGLRTLLVSTDPAHSLGDLLGRRLGPDPRRVTPTLDALEIDPEHALARYIGEVKANLRELASPELRDAAERQADLAALAPGGAEAALFDEIVRILLDVAADYDQLVFDTAPTGHTLQLLALPEIMGTWTEALLARRRRTQTGWQTLVGDAVPPEDRAAAILDRRRSRFASSRELLLDARRTRFVPVLNPDALSREETARMLKALAGRGIPIDTLIVNRVLPEDAHGDFIAQRRRAESRHLDAIDREFGRLRRLRVELRADEIAGLDALRALAGQLTLPSLPLAPGESGL